VEIVHRPPHVAGVTKNHRPQRTKPADSEVSLPAETLQLTAEVPVVSPSTEKLPVAERAKVDAFSVDAVQNVVTQAEDFQAPLAILEAPSLSGGHTRRDEKFLAKYGPWAVVTGASKGIGSEFSRSLAEKGMNVVLVARSGDKLKKTAQSIREEYGVETRIVAADLSKPEGLEAVKTSTADLEVGMLVNNAGTWQFGSFLDNDIERDVLSVALNVEAPMVLSHHFAGKMVHRGKGGVVNVGSGAALHGVPGQAAYSATKGFLRNFTESLYRELKPKGVDVIITNPGPVQGEASTAYNQSKVPLQKMTGKSVADDALARLGRGSSTIPGWFNKIAMGVAVRALPRDMLASIAGYILEQATPAATEAAAPVLETNKTEATALSGTSAKALKATSEGAAQNAAGGVLGYLWGAAQFVTKPITSAFSTVKFALGFMGDMRTRAQEITHNNGQVEATLKAAGLHHEYRPPVNKSNLNIEGKMLVKANMAEFFDLWNSWITKGYGSINDRQYADLVLKFRDQAKELPLLAHVPMTSEDVFSAKLEDGLMTSMKETTTARLGGLIPTSKVDWQYHRSGQPTGSNSFEATIDRFDGDVAKVQAFYQDLFDPKHVNPNSKATVEFVMREVKEVQMPERSGLEFEHAVHVPLGSILPQPDSTLPS
jgi:uncharacterized protein